MSKHPIDNYDELVLSIDNYINLKSQTRADIYGWLTGVVIFSMALIYIYWGGIQISGINFLYIILAPFPLTYFFGKANAFGWRTDRYLKKLIAKEDIADCFCNLKKLSPYPEFGWKETRYREFYSCILYSFISSFLMGCCLVSSLWLIFRLFNI